jgi:hypothetical protein
MKNNQKGFGILEVFFVILVLGLISCLGWFVYSRNNNNTVTFSGSKTSSKTILNHTIPLTDCSKVKPKLQKQLDSFDGDMCYSAPIKAGSETIEYVIIDQSKGFQDKKQKDYDKNCSFDCGGSIPITREDFIIRANGKAEFASPEWTGSAAIALEHLTGCALGDLDKYDKKGEFVVDNGRVGIHFAGKDIDYSEEFGNSCKVTIDLVAYTSTEKPSLTFRNIEVQYSLTDPSTCVHQDKDGADQCYSDQAGMRSDIAICDKTYFERLGTLSEGCVKSVATRKRDTAICQKASLNSQQQCIDLVNEAKSYFSGEIKTTGL